MTGLADDLWPATPDERFEWALDLLVARPGGDGAT